MPDRRSRASLETRKKGLGLSHSAGATLTSESHAVLWCERTAHGSVDLGEAFTYTGSGGRDLKGTKQNPKNLRTAPQTFDQSFSDAKNASLKVSFCTHPYTS